ncbi:MAG: hypothetical protein HY233_04305 [Acidobacteriales bacterium]|nr:hypothetical protein [Terriglobales bacterium]
MISDPNLPLARSSTGLPELQPPPNAPSPQPAQEPVARPPRSAAYLWLRRVGVLLFVFLCATIGVMLMILPWRPEWADNHLLLPFPTLRSIVSSGFARGVCTGLGVLNVWIGFWEAIQYREDG